MNRLNSDIRVGKFFKVAAGVNLAVWLLVIFPSVYFKGLSNSLLSLRSSYSCFFNCFLLFLSVSSNYLLLMYWILSGLLGNLILSEKQVLYSSLINDNPGIQLVIILIPEENHNSVEALIWLTVFFLYTCCKAFCVIITTRLSNSKLQNLNKLNTIMLLQTSALLIINLYVFSKSGFWLSTMLNFESVFILKSVILTYYQLTYSNISSLTELKLEIFESFFKLIQWVQIGLINGFLGSSSPVEFLLLIKIQYYFTNLLTSCSQYSKYISSISIFTLKFPPLSHSEIKHFSDEKCSVCWEMIHTEQSCKLTCQHIFHIECIWKWMLRSTEWICPVCKQTFLEPEQLSFFSLSSFFSRNQDSQRILNIFPHLTENELIREIEQSGSVHQAIENLLGK